MTSPSTSWKEATDTTAGDSTKYGVPDGLLLYAQLFNGDSNVDNVDIASPWFFRTSKCYFLNTAGTYGFLVDSSAAIVADRTVTLPLLTGDDTFVMADFIQTISSKKIGNWLDAVEIAAPSSPASSEHRTYYDSTSNQLTTKNSAGTVQEFTTNSGTQTLTNKTITSPTFTALDNAFTLQDNADQTKQAVFQLSGITTGNTRTYTLPDADTTLGGGDAVTSNGLDQFAATTSLELLGVISDETGTGSLVFATSPTLVTPLLGTPTSGTLTNCTGLPITGITSSTSAEFATLCSDETGSGLLVFGTSPTLITPILGTPTSGTLTNCTIPANGVTYDINAQTGTTYTFVLGDAGDIVTSSNASTVAMTIPPNSSVAFPVGSSITVISIGAGLTNFAQGSGVTITSTGAVSSAPVLRAQHSSATAIKTATDTWRVVGDIS
jgi:hypothetical protein